MYENPESGGGEESHVWKEKRCSGARSVQPGDALSVGKKQPLLVVVLTAINLLLLVMRSSTQFLFSASFPSYLYIIGG